MPLFWGDTPTPDPRFRFDFDAARNVVNLMAGNLCVAQMTLADYEAAFGLRAASTLLRGA